MTQSQNMVMLTTGVHPTKHEYIPPNMNNKNRQSSDKVGVNIKTSPILAEQYLQGQM